MNSVSIDRAALKEIKGFLDDREGEALHRLAGRACRLGPCLEIGAYCGKSTAWIGAACRTAGSVLFSIDHHRGSEEQQPGQAYFDPDLFDQRTGRVDTFSWFLKTLEHFGLEDCVVPMVCRSQLAARAWKTPLGLVFIDGGHDYDSVFTDYAAWSVHLVPGGYLIFHDIFLDPKEGGQAPRKVYEQAAASGMFEMLPMVNTLGILSRLI